MKMALTYCNCAVFIFQKLPVFLRVCPHTIQPDWDSITIMQPRLQPVAQLPPRQLAALAGDMVWSTKYDGVRVHLCSGGQVFTKSGYSIPYVQHPLEVPDGHILDAEMICQRYIVDGQRKTYEDVMLRLRDHLGTGFVFRVIDVVTLPQPFQARYDWLCHRYGSSVVKQEPVHSLSAVYTILHNALDRGDEGVVIRNRRAMYSHRRRSTILFKLKDYDRLVNVDLAT